MEKQLYIWTAKMNAKGQIVIPKEARKVFNINPNDTLLLLGDINRGIAIAKYEDYNNFAKAILNANGDKNDKN
ncbi:MAG: AbrB/MazE/SpoVT family DNA-binding domain-containing protein [Clostridia bacterium]|jgi:AbrB family looped-hinge helix DNA binding protein|nr:AbrB/MazE/SpoVT family DNA-binding domain-containing protein [Clostridia bacterium]